MVLTCGISHLYSFWFLPVVYLTCIVYGFYLWYISPVQCIGLTWGISHLYSSWFLPVIIQDTMRGRIIILSILMSMSPGKDIRRMADFEGSAERRATPKMIPANTPPMVSTSSRFSLPQEWHCRKNKRWRDKTLRRNERNSITCIII